MSAVAHVILAASLRLDMPEAWPAAMVLAVAGVATVMWSYRRDARGARAWWALPFLRLVAVAALVLAMFKPVALAPRDAADVGKIAVLVDASRSMGVVDSATQRSPAEQVRVAAALGLLPPGVRADTLGPLREAIGSLTDRYDAARRLKGELDYAQLTGRGVAEARRRVDEARARIDEAMNRLVALAGESVTTQKLVPRLKELAREFARPDGSIQEVDRRLNELRGQVNRLAESLDEELYQRDASVRAACGQIAGLTRLDLAIRAVGGAQSPLAALLRQARTRWLAFDDDVRALALGGLVAEGPASDIAGALREARRAAGPDLDAIVLVSDGRQVEPPGRRDTGIESGGVPVFSLGVGTGPPRPDLAIRRVDTPAEIFAGDVASVQVELLATNLPPDTAADVTVSVGDRRETRRVQLAQRRNVVDVPLKIDEAGVARVEVSVPQLPGELSVENNRVDRRIKVIADRVRVELLSASPRWDVTYVRNALTRTPWVQLDDRFVRPGERVTAWADGSGDLPDVLIWCDVPPDAVDDARWRQVESAVQRGACGLIVMAGDVSVLRAWARHPVARNLLPWDPSSGDVAWRTWPGESPGLRVEPDPAGADAEAARLDDEPDASRRRWFELPPLYRVLQMPRLRPGAAAILREADSLSPVLVRMRAGAGSVLLMGTDETWRWRYKVGDRDHQRLWRQLVRLTAGPPYAARSGDWALDADRVLVAPGEAVRLRVRRPVGGATTRPVEAPPPEVELLRDGVVVRTIPTVASGEGDGRYTGDVESLDAGPYTLRLSTGSPINALSLPLDVRNPTTEEMVDLSGDAANLRRIADSTGGAMARLPDLASLPDRIRDVLRERRGVVEMPIWSSWWTYAIVVGALGLEWALRKTFGML